MNNKMTRASQVEADEMRTLLLAWHPIDKAQALLEEMKKPLGYYAASQGRMKFWREAHCGCAFGRHLQASAIRLCDPDPPDFELMIDEKIVACELLEIRDPNSRIGDEFNQLAELENQGKTLKPQPFDTEAHIQWLPCKISLEIGKKSKKNYAPDITLAVFVHAWIFHSQRNATDEAIRAAAEPYSQKFSSIYVLTDGEILKI